MFFLCFRGGIVKSSRLAPEQKSRSIARARGISEIGNSIRQVILALAILSIRERPEDLFLGEVLESSGYLAMSLIAPFFIDRLKRLKSLVIADVFSLLNTVLLILAVLWRSLPLLWLGSFFMTFIASFYGSTLYAVTAQYSGAEKREVRLGLSFLQQNILIGALIGLLGTSFALPKLPLEYFLLFDAVTFLFSSIWIFKITRYDLLGEENRPFRYKSFSAFFKGLWLEWREGFQGALRSTALRRLLLGNCMTCFAYGIFESAVVSTQKMNLGFSDSLVTLSRALNRVSAIGGTYFVTRFSQRHRSWTGRRLLVVGTGLASVGTALMSVASTPFFIGSNIFYNFGWSFLNPTVGSELAHEAPRDLLGRVQAFRSLLIHLSILLGNVAVLLLSVWLDTQKFFLLTSCFLLIAIFLWRKQAEPASGDR
jgi:hypothetical protein